MKTILAWFLLLIFLCPLCAFGETAENWVVEMPYQVKLPDVTRTGLYSGQVINSIPNGYGVFVATNSQGVEWHYLGQWVNGEMCGQGGQYWDNGEARVGLYASNELILGEIHTNTMINYMIDRREETLQSYR